MNNIFKYITILSLSAMIFVSCEKDKTEIDYSLTQLTDLPMGEEGSIDRLIYDINKKYDVTFRYDFEPIEMWHLWTSNWKKYFAKADMTDDGRYVRTFIEKIKDNVLDRYEVSFIKKLFPSRVFLVDSLFSAGDTGNIFGNWVEILTNDVNLIAVSNVGVASDKFNDEKWKSLMSEVNTIFTVFYYGNYPKPTSFISGKGKISSKDNDPTIDQTPPLSQDTKDKNFEYRSKKAGFAKPKFFNGKPMNMNPDENYDFADFVNYLTTTPATKIKSDFNRDDYKLFKKRGVILESHLRLVIGMDVISTQHKNCPSDKLENDFFTNLQ